MPRKSKPKPDQASKSSKAKPPHPNHSSSSPSSKRRKTTHENDSTSTPNNPESAQAPPEPSELESPDTTSKLNPIARHTRIPPPPPPPSVPSSFVLLPPEADDAAIREKWDIHTISLGGAGAKIEAKVRQVLNIFKPVLPVKKDKKDGTNTGADESSTEKPGETTKKRIIVALTARAPAGNKCISVAEIVKRDLLAKGVEGVWQYTGCWTRLETYVAPKAKEARNTIHNSTASTNGNESEVKEDDAMEDVEESAFETMQIAERKLVRNAVCLVIYLAMEPVARLKELYGEQVFHPEGKEKT
jgi:hypothetical protein